MSYRIVLVDPRDGSEEYVLDGITKRPASWSTLNKAVEQVEDWNEHNPWNRAIDGFKYRAEVREFHRDNGESDE